MAGKAVWSLVNTCHFERVRDDRDLSRKTLKELYKDHVFNFLTRITQQTECQLSG